MTLNSTTTNNAESLDAIHVSAAEAAGQSHLPQRKNDDVELKAAMEQVGIEIKSSELPTVSPYSSKPKSLFQKYYTPIYKEHVDKKSGAKTLKAYYGNGRFTKVAWITIHVLLALLIFMIIMLPITYFVIFPSFLQYCIDQIGINGHTIKIYKQAVGNFTQDSLFLSADLRFTPWSIFPLPGGFGANTIEITTLTDEKSLASISVPSASFMLNQEIKLDTEAHITWSQEQQDNVYAVLSQLSTRAGIKDFGIKVKLNAPVQSMGLTLYPSLALHRDIPLGDSSFDALVKSLLNPAPVVNPGPPIFQLINKESDYDAALQSQFSADEITTLPESLGGFSLVWKSLEAKVSDLGLGASLALAFENWSPLTLAPISSVELYLGLQGSRIAKLKLENLGLDGGLNAQFAPSASVEFLGDELVAVEKFQSILEDASHAYATTFDFGLSVMGPIKISNAEFVEKVTRDLKIGVSLSQLLQLAPASLLTVLQHPPALNVSAGIPPELQSILGNSSLNLVVGNEKISSLVDLNLPALSFIKAPRNISLPFTASVSIYGGGAASSSSKIVDFNTLPIKISTTSGISIKAGLDIVPVNSDAAASSLASSLNPILAAKPSNSSIGIKDLFLFPLESTTPYKWTQRLFGERVLSIGLPPIDKAGLMDTLNAASSNKAAAAATAEVLKIAAPVGAVSIAQLTTLPGFSATASAKISASPSLPKVVVDMGYINVDARVATSTLVSLSLPSGLKWTDVPESTVALQAQLVFARSDSLSSNLQAAVDSVLQEGSAESSVGVSGIAFGQSSSSHIVTFSKVVVDVDTALIKKILANGSGGEKGLALPLPPLSKGMVKINGASLEIPGINTIATRIDAQIQNPTSLSLDLGSVKLDSFLNGKRLSGVEIGAIKLGQGSSSTSLALSLSPSTGANGLAQDIASLANAVLRKDTNLNLPLSVSGLVLSPPGVSSGPAVIDQFKNLKVSASTRALLSTLLSSSNKAAQQKLPLDLLDLTAITGPLQDKNILSKLAPSLKYVQLLQQPSSRIAAGIDAAYTNPLPISTLVSYLGLEVAIDGSDAVALDVSSIQLVRQNGLMQPRINMAFKQGLSSKVSKLVKGLLDGRLSSSIVVKNVRFGGSASSNNDLISQVSLDVSKLASSSSVTELSSKLQQVLSDAGASVTIEKRDQTANSLIFKGPLGSSITLTNLDAEFQADRALSAGVGANIVLPFSADINLPFLSLSAGLDDAKVLDLTTGLQVFGKGSLSTNVKTLVKFSNDGSAPDKVAGIVNAVLQNKKVPGSLSLSGIRLGNSEQDSNDALSALQFSLSLAKLLAPSLSGPSSPGSSGSLDPAVLLNSLHPSLSTIDFQLLPGRTISLNLGVGLTMPFPVKLKGLGYLSAAVSVNNEDDVVVLKASNFEIQPGTQSINLNASTVFPAVSEKTKNALSAFADRVVQGKRTEDDGAVVSLRHLGFGQSDSSHISLLSKVNLGFTANKLIDFVASSSPSVSSSSPSLQTLASRVASSLDSAFLKTLKMHLDTDSSIQTVIVGGLAKTSLKASVSLGYTAISLLLDSNKLLDMRLSSPIQVSTANEKVTASISSSLSLSSSLGIQDTLEGIAAKIADNKVDAIKTGLGVTGLVFGTSDAPRDVIDTFSSLKIYLPLAKLLKPVLASAANATTASLPSFLNKVKIAPRKVELDVLDEESLSTVLEANIENLPVEELDVSIPFLYGRLKINGNDLLTNEITSLSIKGTKISASIAVHFPESPSVRTSIQSLFTDVGNLLWGQADVSKIAVKSVTLVGAGMGVSESSSIKLLEKVPVSLSTASLIQKASQSSLGVSLVNLDVSLQHEGIRILARTSDLGFPLVLKNSIKSESKWAMNGTLDPSQFITLMHVSGPPLTLPHAAVSLTPPANVGDMVLPMREALVKMLTWESYGTNARLGFLSLISQSGKVFNKFDAAWFGGPDWLLAPPTFYIDSNFEKPLATVDPGLNPIYFATTISVINNTPLHLDVGKMEVYTESYDPSNPKGYHDPDPDSIVLSMICDRDIVVRNWNEGGNLTSQAGPPTQALFHGTLVAFGYLEWRSLFETAFALDPVSRQPNYRTLLRTRRDGKVIKWFDDFNYSMEDSHFTALLLPHFDLIAKHLVYHSSVPTSAS